MLNFRDTESRASLCEDNYDAPYSNCCQGSPIGECRKCGDLVCEDHGVIDEEGDTWCREHAPEVAEITPLQVMTLAELAGVAL